LSASRFHFSASRGSFAASIHRPHRLLQRVQPHARIARRKSAVFENRIVKEIRGGHRHLHAGLAERLFELAHDAISIAGGSIDRDQIVVMKIDAIRAQLTQTLHDRDRTNGRARGVAKRIASPVADSPQAKSEFMFGFWLIVIICHCFPFYCSISSIAWNAGLG
jgi:hypothetical protein